MQQLRNKNVTEKDLEKIFMSISDLENRFIQEAKKYLGVGMEDGKGGMFTIDLYVSAIVNRSISLMRGFLQLSKEDNYISAIPFIRLQLDNCLRFYASVLVSDQNDFFQRYLNDEYIANIIDAKGKKMSDTYLSKELDKIFPGVRVTYQNSSAYVHLSNRHSFIQTKVVKDKERTISTRIGYYDFFPLIKKSISPTICTNRVKFYYP